MDGDIYQISYMAGDGNDVSLTTNPSALPIELLSFSAQLVDRAYVDLKWQTATEINNDYFTIER